MKEIRTTHSHTIFYCSVFPAALSRIWMTLACSYQSSVAQWHTNNTKANSLVDSRKGNETWSEAAPTFTLLFEGKICAYLLLQTIKIKSSDNFQYILDFSYKVHLTCQKSSTLCCGASIICCLTWLTWKYGMMGKKADYRQDWNLWDHNFNVFLGL